MAKKKQEPESQDTNSWIATYTDLMTLLLTFFVLLLSMSVRDNVRVRKALDSLTGAFGLLPGGRSPLGKAKGLDVRGPAPPMRPSKPINLEMLQQKVVKNNLSADIQLLRQKQKLIIRIDQRVLFLPNSTILDPKIYDYLTMLASYLKKNHGDIAIRGYTDPYEGLDHPHWATYSWQLSTRRAMAVYDFFLKHGLSYKRLSAHGFSYFHPIIDDLTYPDLSYKNRRVEIMLAEGGAIPSSLLHEPLKPASYLDYKDFIFRLLPASKNPAGQPVHATAGATGSHGP